MDGAGAGVTNRIRIGSHTASDVRKRSRRPMTEPVTITRVMALNYKSVAACNVPLGPLAVVVGRSSSIHSGTTGSIRKAVRSCELRMRTRFLSHTPDGSAFLPGSRCRRA